MSFKSSVLRENASRKTASNRSPLLRAVPLSHAVQLPDEQSNHEPTKDRRAKDRRAGRKLTSPYHRHAMMVQVVVQDSLPACEVRDEIDAWIAASEFRNTPATLLEKKSAISKLPWFLETRALEECGTTELLQVLAHVKNGHLSPLGRWDNPQNKTPVRPIRVRGYFNVLRAFFNYLVKKGTLTHSPVAAIDTPDPGKDRIHLFSPEDMWAILEATDNSWHPVRDRAVVLFLYDTGVRANELCGLRMKNVDLKRRRVVVHGKGDKFRVVGLGDKAFNALWKYLGERSERDKQGKRREINPDAPVFLCDRGVRAHEALQYGGLKQLINRLGKAARIEIVRCSPHTFRHTFATDYLRGEGGDLASLQRLMGHMTPSVTQKYIHLSSCDLSTTHRKNSPADRLLRRK